MSKNDELTLNKYLDTYNLWQLFPMEILTKNLKSLILSILMAKNKITVVEAMNLSRIEENW